VGALRNPPPEGPPEHLTAICCHILIRARAGVSLASDRLRRAREGLAEVGLTEDAVDRALRLLELDPHILETQERQTGAILASLRAPGVEVETLEIVERRTDEPKESRAERIWRKGWITAVLNRPADPPPNQDEARTWLDGFNAFRAALRAYENRKPRARQAIAA
jgi:hypothetical protein